MFVVVVVLGAGPPEGLLSLSRVPLQRATDAAHPVFAAATVRQDVGEGVARGRDGHVVAWFQLDAVVRDVGQRGMDRRL